MFRSIFNPLRARLRRPAPPDVRLTYGPVFPSPDEFVYGGGVKLLILARHYADFGDDANLAYFVSPRPPPEPAAYFEACRKRGLRSVWNQNGVAYPAWAGPGYRDLNRVTAEALRNVDYVLYQSRFAQASTERFIGEAPARSCLLYNPVDTAVFTPPDDPLEASDRVLMSGTHGAWHRLELGVRAFRLMADAAGGRPLRLVLAGQVWDADRARLEALVASLGLAGRVEATGRYSQEEAPGLYRGAALLLHTQYNDVCPSVVLEAMACGVPVAHLDCGGTPELVGPDAGAAVDVPRSYDRIPPLPPEPLAEAAAALLRDRDRYSRAARERAVREFDLRLWLARHDAVFRELLAS